MILKFTSIYFLMQLYLLKLIYSQKKEQKLAYQKKQNKKNRYQLVSTAVNKAGWMLVDGSRIHQSDLVPLFSQISPFQDPVT